MEAGVCFEERLLLNLFSAIEVKSHSLDSFFIQFIVFSRPILFSREFQNLCYRRWQKTILIRLNKKSTRITNF